MKESDGLRIPRSSVIICLALFALLPFMSQAQAISTAVIVVNNRNGEIRNLYSSHVDSDDWGADLLGDATIGSGQSFRLNDVSCDGQQTKLIAEDQDGCVISTVVTCGQSSTWTISNDSARDCGY